MTDLSLAATLRLTLDKPHAERPAFLQGIVEKGGGYWMDPTPVPDAVLGEPRRPATHIWEIQVAGVAGRGGSADEATRDWIRQAQAALARHDERTARASALIDRIERDVLAEAVASCVTQEVPLSTTLARLVQRLTRRLADADQMETVAFLRALAAQLEAFGQTGSDLMDELIADLARSEATITARGEAA